MLYGEPKVNRAGSKINLSYNIFSENKHSNGKNMNPNNLVVSAGSILLSLLLVGCGGGGGGDGGAPAGPVVASSAEGVYEGTISNGRIHNTIVLENDQFFTLYGVALPGGGTLVTGLIQGNGKSNNGSFSSTDLKDFASGTVVSGSLSASYTAKTSLNGSITEGSSTVTFTGTSPLKNSLYVYEAAANLANIVGAWSLLDQQGSSTALNILSSGAFTGTSSGCSFSGTLNPRASGKNIFDLALIFGAAPCPLVGQTANGIAVEYPLSNGSRQLFIAGTNAARTNATALLGVR